MVNVRQTWDITCFAVYLSIVYGETSCQYNDQFILMILSIYSYEILEGVYIGVPHHIFPRRSILLEVIPLQV